MKICRQCSMGFEVTDEDREFYAKVSPKFGGKKFLIPEPTRCPDCREQRRITFRNDRDYYSRTCDLCKKPIIALYDPTRTQNVYCLQCWWSDRWDPQSFGRDFDFNRPFFEQFAELLKAVPKISMMNDNGVQSENCEYTTDFAYGKNCYMVISSWYDENCLYGFQINYDKNCVDNTWANNSEAMYEAAACEKCFGCQEVTECSECSDCIFGYDLKNCSDCLFSAGLRNKRYCIWNQQYSKEDYLTRKKLYDFGNWSKREEYKKQFAQFLLQIPRKFANLVNCENSSGNHLVNCKNAEYCFNHRGLYFCKYMTNGDVAKMSYDCNSTGGPELCYECITPDNAYQEIFCVNSWKSQFVLYSDNCQSCQYVFGCANMKRKRYCILNKQYSKSDYEELAPQIIEHMHKTREWGEFFPASISPFAYNESSAQEWFPMTKEEAQKAGYRWMDDVRGTFQKETIRWDQIPDRIADLAIDITREIVVCLECQRNYKITAQEVQFYKTYNIPLPRLCVYCRHLKRKERMNSKQLWQRKCAHCGTVIKTPYSLDRPETVLCEICYHKIVY